MRTSKYLNKKFDNNWVCTYVGIAYVSGKRHHKTNKVSKRPGHRTYYYIFERPTSDNKADKMIRLNAALAAKVYKGLLKVEDIAKERLEEREKNFTSKVSYSFY